MQLARTHSYTLIQMHTCSHRAGFNHNFNPNTNCRPSTISCWFVISLLCKVCYSETRLSMLSMLGERERLWYTESNTNQGKSVWRTSSHLSLLSPLLVSPYLSFYYLHPALSNSSSSWLHFTCNFLSSFLLPHNSDLFSSHLLTASVFHWIKCVHGASRVNPPVSRGSDVTHVSSVARISWITPRYVTEHLAIFCCYRITAYYSLRYYAKVTLHN